ncbi:leucyl/phenylalanyl-tRNA--protein transferase [Agriterribacter sp.]|uniref:leucyl/phenylalanyl-tRNA--protein transferase n=1 Tax=Agriterribacter sp. TaxID=2821509 RepID=UPI002BCD2856|nr:leucyl/phenylalanyl-tRNA--protein transferase [Agriterribacter sp.]HTN09306.1 leucyl/phenylalanyl-tRNA--protein transferase [Agriterribacter sp.]
MALFALQQELIFPPVHLAEPDGLLAMGGDLSTERLLLAYRNGIFPWYEGNVPLWWCPDPRFVLFPGNLKISKSMQQLIKKETFRVSINTSFKSVIRACKTSPRKQQQGTWITDEVEEAYCLLHEKGYAHSAEAWMGDELAGGLYGIRMGKVFFGESMFSRESNASKFAFTMYVQLLQQEGIELIDCQIYTAHLESLGAQMIPREIFMKKLNLLLK